MTPGAHVAAAIEIIDRILAGETADRALIGWTRRSRFAGSKDRAAIRDLVFSVLRRRRSAAAMGGACTCRGLLIGLMRQDGVDLGAVFSGQGYAPAPVSPEEFGAPWEALSPAVQADVPDWVYDKIEPSRRDAVWSVLRQRAPVFARVNRRAGSPEDAIRMLADDGVQAVPHQKVMNALEVVGNARRLKQSAAYLDGLIELQDASSQALSDLVPIPEGGRILDFCAGGGGKTLAMAARVEASFFAHDIAPGRMVDLPSRAKRAGVEVTVVNDVIGKFDTVVCDVPCSGSGSWRRNPEGKWTLTPEQLAELVSTQANILDEAADLTAPGGTLAYATCSIFAEENGAQIAAFLSRNPSFVLREEHYFEPSSKGDGFYLAILGEAEPAVA
ncbi:RsmB/NOP family class I SAM-dependent RNA methyltransferase [Aestuariibius insulae]|uniref:RsmB/NOP family class I SAM-dependent RNA methyltransferase n=1 Tax=Aestuariibius insulae TaxID=2058287 RepID=UPI00345E9508